MRRFVADLDARFAGRALAWAGGVALVLAAIFFVSLASSRGWIGPELRIALGVAAGLGALALGAVVLARGNRLIGHVLTPVGLAVVSISMVGATRLLDVLPVPIALIVVLASALLAAWIAIRFDAQVVAGFGLVAVLIAPPLLGAPADLGTLVFVATVLVGTTAVALWRAWGWLPPLAFLLSAPQVAVWVGNEPSVAIGLTGSIGYWLLQVVAAGGEAIRRHRLDLRAWSAGLLMGAAAFLVWCGFAVFDDALVPLRPAFLVVVALVHLAIGLWVLRRDGEGSMVGLLLAATGVAVLTLAVPIQFEAPLVPVVWTAEAVAVLWVGVERRHRASRVGAAVLYGLAATALLIESLGRDQLPLAALATFAAGIGVGVWLVRGTRAAHLLAASGLVAVAIVAGTGDDPVLAAVLLGAIIVGGALVWRWLGRFGPVAPTRFGGLTLPILDVAALATGALAIGYVTELDLSPRDWDVTGALSALLVAGALLIAGALRDERTAATIAAIAAGGTVAWIAPILDPASLTVVVWAATTIGWVLAARVGWLHVLPTRVAAGGLLALAAVTALAHARPSRLVLDATPVDLETALGSAAALGAVLLGLAALAWSESNERRRAWLWLVAGVWLVYLASIVLLDTISRLTAGLGADERATIGQTALTLLWAGLGIAAFVIGLRRRHYAWRLAGLALLGVTTLKVFLVDLAGLDLAYRVVSLLGLGLVLLAGAWLWQRSQARVDADASGSGG